MLMLQRMGKERKLRENAVVHQTQQDKTISDLCDVSFVYFWMAMKKMWLPHLKELNSETCVSSSSLFVPSNKKMLYWINVLQGKQTMNMPHTCWKQSNGSVPFSFVSTNIRRTKNKFSFETERQMYASMQNASNTTEYSGKRWSELQHDALGLVWNECKCIWTGFVVCCHFD